MTTAVDTNIFLDILLPNPEFFAASAAALQNAADDGSLVVADIVYAELCVHFETQRGCDRFLESNQIRVQSLTRESLFAASRAWRTYLRQGGKRTMVLADFLIGAHAAHQASRLLTRDRGFYSKLFPTLKIWDSASHKQTQ